MGRAAALMLLFGATAAAQPVVAPPVPPTTVPPPLEAGAVDAPPQPPDIGPAPWGEGIDANDWAGVRGGADLGFATLELQSYLEINLGGRLRLGPFRWDFRAPLRFNADGFRTADYDEGRDWARIGRCLRVDVGHYTAPTAAYDPTCAAYGWKDRGLHDRLYFSARLSPLREVTLGHGTLVYGYRSSLDLERPELGGEVDVELYDWGAVRFFLDDVTRPGVLGGRLNLRPLQVFLGLNDDATPDELDVGVTLVGDVDAPLHRMTAFGRGLQDENGDALFVRDTVGAIGVDVSYTYLANPGDVTRPRVGVFLFADVNHFLGLGDATAVEGGARFVVHNRTTGWHFRLGAEARLLGNRFVPEYFDADYTIQSQRYALNDDALAQPGVDPLTTKLEYLRSLPGGFTWGLQGYLLLEIPAPDRHHLVPIRAFLEDADGPVNASVSLVVGPYRMEQVSAMALYQRRGFDDLSGILSLDGTLIRLLGHVVLGHPDAEPGTLEGVLRFFYVDLRFDRRYFQTPQGDFRETNDFVLTAGFNAGTGS